MVLLNGIVIWTWILFISTVQGIRDGYNATKSQFPYNANIDVFDEYLQKVTTCSGAIISQYFIITSYECVSRGKIYLITLGCVYHPDEQPICERLTSDRLYAFADAFKSTSSTIRNYVAVLQVDTMIYFNAFIQRVSLSKPTTNANDPLIIPSSYNYANATGSSLPDGKKYLQWLHMKVVNNSECAAHFPHDEMHYSLCAQGEDEDGNKHGNLFSEAGVPLVRNNTLIGILKGTYVTSDSGGLSLFIDVQSFSNRMNITHNSIVSDIPLLDANQNELRNATQNELRNATQNEFPYHARIDVYYGDHISSRTYANNCSGAVISSKFVISARYCVWNGTGFRIKLGSLNPYSADDKPAYHHETRHPAIFPADTKVDECVALLKVDVDIDFYDSIQPITLPQPKTNAYNSDYYYATATGYYNITTRHLQWLKMRVYPTTSCNNTYREDLLSNSLCVSGWEGRTDENLCNDQGVPLVLSDSKTLVGILVGNDKTCKDLGLISLFIDVKRYVNWINYVINTPNVELANAPSILEYNEH